MSSYSPAIIRSGGDTFVGQPDWVAPATVAAYPGAGCGPVAPPALRAGRDLALLETSPPVKAVASTNLRHRIGGLEGINDLLRAVWIRSSLPVNDELVPNLTA